MDYRRIAASCLCAAVMLAGYSTTSWGEAGELFPNVKPYNDEVPSPVTKPEQSLDKKPPARLPTEPPLGPLPKINNPALKKNTPPEPVARRISWAPYQAALLAPMLPPDLQTRFDTDFAPRIEASLKSKTLTEEADSLWKDAQADDIPPDLKTVIWLHALGLALRAPSSLEDRSAKAQTVLPLLHEDTLAVAQARDDAVTGLAFGALSKASDDLLAMALESECKLARMQIQCGFLAEAEQNRNVAKDILGYLKDKTDAQKSLLAETSAWVDSAAAAQASVPGWQKILAYHPENTAVNTQMAELSVALFGDLIKAAPYAAKSNRPDLQNLASLIDQDAAAAKDLNLTTPQSFTLAAALLNVAQNAGNAPFDRYAIALMVQKRMADLAGRQEAPPAIAHQAAALEARAGQIIAKSGYIEPAFTALAALQTAPESKPGAPAAKRPKLQLFVKDNGVVVKYVKPTATENAEALKLIREFAKDIGDKSNLQFSEVETDHCLILTDWDPSEYGFLKKNVEGSYLEVAKAFDYPVNENVFPGKLPVFMLTNRKHFLAFTKAFYGREAIHSGGIFETSDSGIGFLALYKPDASAAEPNPLVSWGRYLTWNMGFAFDARYRTNKQLPLWLDEGIACRLALSHFPDPSGHIATHSFHDQGASIVPLLTAKQSSYRGQCVMSSIVEMLMATDKKQFIEFLNKIKYGEDQDTALKETFHCTPEQLNKAWQNWIAKTPDPTQ